MPRNFATLGPSEYSRRLLGIRVKAKRLFLLILQHWAGVSLNTSFCKLAETCVFVKQSLSPILCQLYKVTFTKSLLIPKLQSHFAELLQHNYLKRLSLLNLFTSVGLRYGVLFKRLFLESATQLLFEPWNKNKNYTLSRL